MQHKEPKLGDLAQCSSSDNNKIFIIIIIIIFFIFQMLKLVYIYILSNLLQSSIMIQNISIASLELLVDE